MLRPGTQTIRFKQPTNSQSSAAKAADASEKLKTGAGSKIIKHTLIREQLNRSNPPWLPSLSVAFRLLVLLRFCAAMYSSISDCDESFNYWEPTHYLVHGKGFQTWEYSPQNPIRSWFYILIHAWPAWLASLAFPLDKRPGFFAIRAMLAFLSSYSEAKLYRAIAEHINPRAARYFLGFSIFSAAMWSASTAYLPSSFAMQAITLAYSYILEPVSSKPSASRRTFMGCLFFAIAVVVGWPFVGVLAVPFLVEELGMYGDDEVMPASRPAWAAGRLMRLVRKGLAATLLVCVPVTLVDSLAYARPVFVPLSLVLYNVFPTPGAGPELYGTEPAHFYIANLLLGFNIILPLALLAGPLVLITNRYSKTSATRLGTKLRLATQSSAAELLLVRLAPVYGWLAIMSRQAHKEERFMQPIYTLITFNAAVCLSLLRGWMEDVFVSVTSSPYRAGRTSIFSTFTRTVLLVAASLSISRILALQFYYHAPLDLMFYFQYTEIPVVAVERHPSSYTYLKLNTSKPVLEALDEAEYAIDLRPLAEDKLTICLGDSWYWFPTQFLVPDPINVEFVKGNFKGILPSKFVNEDKYGVFDGNKTRGENLEEGSVGIWRWKGTRKAGGMFNDKNSMEEDRFVDLNTQCTYFIGTHYPHRPTSSQGHELSLIAGKENEEWETRKCVKMLDGDLTPRGVRSLWVPPIMAGWWSEVGEGRGVQRFGEMCLYRRKT